ncbi:MAG: hypothetical protein DRJ66_04975 [Thermoprotei archaeon]|nr:MAG: hypothetical protein DRJ66_04975 [Thermoprotei archaeon]
MLKSRRVISIPLVAIVVATTILGVDIYRSKTLSDKVWLTELSTKGYSYSYLIIKIDKVLVEGKPIPDKGKLIMVIRNFTKCPSTLLYQGKFKTELKYRIFVKLVKLLKEGKEYIPVVTPIHNYAITIMYWDGKELYDGVVVLEVEPREPVIVKNVVVNLTRTPKGS